MIGLPTGTKVRLAAGTTDMRSGSTVLELLGRCNIWR